MTTTQQPGSPGAGDSAKQAAGAAGDGAKQMASDAADQAKAVAATAKDEVQRFTGQAKDELGWRAQEQSARLAGGLQGFAGQLTALADGRNAEAGALPNYLGDLEGKVRQVAQRLEQGGPQGVLDDVTGFARRKPGVFLVGALGAGFAIGRLVRSGAAERSDPEYQPDAPDRQGELPAPAVPLGSMTGTSSTTGITPGFDDDRPMGTVSP